MRLSLDDQSQPSERCLASGGHGEAMTCCSLQFPTLLIPVNPKGFVLYVSIWTRVSQSSYLRQKKKKKKKKKNRLRQNEATAGVHHYGMSLQQATANICDEGLSHDYITNDEWGYYS